MAKKRSRKKQPKQKVEQQQANDSDVATEELLITTTDLEKEPVEVQFTDTSYTSASFESLPPVVVEETKKRKKKKAGKSAPSKIVSKESSDFQWSEDSLTEVEIPSRAPVEGDKRRKKFRRRKKGKKDKDQKKDDEIIPEFEKPRRWKKMNKKERQAWLEQQLEEYRAQKEAEKQEFLAGIKERRKEEAKQRNALMVRDTEEQEIRNDILQRTVQLFNKFEQEKMAYIARKQELGEWLQYLRCDGLPDPRLIPEMNTYIHLWRKTTVGDDEELQRRCVETLPVRSQ